MIRESKIEHRVNLDSARVGILHLKLRPHVVGYPDDLYLREWPYIRFIEYKAPGRAPAPIQERRIADLRRRGYPVEVIDDVDNGLAFLDASIVPGASSGAMLESGVPGAPSFPWTWKDYNYLLCSINSLATKAHKAHDSYSSTASLLQCLAETKERLERICASASDNLAWKR